MQSSREIFRSNVFFRQQKHDRFVLLENDVVRREFFDEISDVRHNESRKNRWESFPDLFFEILLCGSAFRRISIDHAGDHCLKSSFVFHKNNSIEIKRENIFEELRESSHREFYR